MNYYYNIDGRNEGPVSEQELHQLAARGLVRPGTPVIEVGGSQWKRYRDIAPQDNAAPRYWGNTMPPAPGTGNLMGRFLSINNGIDKLLSRLLKLPGCFPETDDKRRELMDKEAGVAGLAIWLSYALLGLGAGSALSSGGSVLLGLLGGVLVGFIVQYVAYHLYTITNSLLLGQKIVLSSMGFPRLLGSVSLAVALALVVMVFCSDDAGDMLSTLCGALVAVGMSYLCFNADKLMVEIRPSDVSPGREFNSTIRFLLRSVFTVAHLLAPALMVLAALGVMLTQCFGGSGAENGMPPVGSLDSVLEMGIIVGVLVHLPLVTWLGLCLSSWFFDLLDGVFAMSRHGAGAAEEGRATSGTKEEV